MFPTIIAVNQTASPILLTRLGLTVPASGSLTLSDYAYRHEIWSDESLYTAVQDGDILISYGQGALSIGESIKLFNLNPQQPVTSPVRVVATTNIAVLSGTMTIDSVNLVATDRVLLTGQDTASENGVWVVQAGAWARPDDCGVGQAIAGTLVAVGYEGTINYAQVWMCGSAAGSDIVGTSDLYFYSAAPHESLQQSYEAGQTIDVTGAVGALIITLESADMRIEGPESFRVGTLAPLDTIDFVSTGGFSVDSAAISIQASAASEFTVTGATLTLGTNTSGTVDVTSAGALNLTAAAASQLTTSAGALTITGAAASTWSTSAGSLSIEGASSLALDANGGALEINATGGAINIGNDADNQSINIGQGGSRAITIGSGTSPVTIGGDLVVSGTTISAQSEIVNIADQTLYLNAGYETVSAVTGGLAVNFLPMATNDVVATEGFTAGVPGVSNPTVITFQTGVFAAGQLIQIAGTTEAANSGLFEVLSSAGYTTTIKGVGLTGTVEDFTQNQFVTSPGAVGTIRRVNVSLMRTGTDGLWETGFGSTTPIVFTDLATATATTLQNAYNNGSTIEATSGEGDIAFTLSSAAFTVNGGNAVDFGGTTPVSTFNVDSSGAVTVDGLSFSIDATTASNLSVTGGGLTLSTLTSGTLAITSAGALNLSGTTADLQASGAVSIDSSGGAISIGADADAYAINIGTGVAARDIAIGNGTGATSVSISAGTGALNLGANAVAHQINIGNQTGATAVTIDSGTGSIAIGTGAQARSISIGTGAASQSVTIGSGTGASTVSIDSGSGAINVGTNAVAHLVNIGNTTGAAGVVIRSGTEQVQIDNVTYYGKSAGDPTVPRAGGFQDGDKYYNTTLDMEMRYDAGRVKWLSVEAAFVYFGRNGTTAAPSFYRGADGLVMSATSGLYAAYNGTIVGLGYTRVGTTEATFEVVEGGVTRASVDSSAASGVDNSLNGNFSQGGILAVANTSDGITNNVSGWAKIKWRSA